jgi:HAD superfamily hydrolase (TIGR01484 family)
MKVEGLFLDYDGTISPLNVPREKAIVAKETSLILDKIKQLIPVGIITTKDLSFVMSRTPFASAWSAIAGLEMKIGDEVIQDSIVEDAVPRVLLALKMTEKLSKNNLYIEKKCNSHGQVLSFCVDWRHINEPQKLQNVIDTIVKLCKSLGLFVIEYERQPFFDVYPCSIDKGNALKKLERKLGIKNGVVYLGDSKVDNTAFRVADISIGVLHEESVRELESNYYIKFEAIAKFLQRLFEANMVFNRDFPEII